MASSRSDTDRDRRTFLKLAGSAAGSVALAGCIGGGGGGDGGDGGDSGDGGDGGGTTTTDDGGTTNGGGSSAPVLYQPSISQPMNQLDPAFVTSGAQDMHKNIYDELITEDADTHGPAAHLATEWESVGDNTWQFTIRDDVTFHDGTQLTAEDLRWSLERYIKLGRGFSSFWKGVVDPDSGVRAPDDTTLEIQTNEPYGPFIATLVQLRAVNKELVQQEASDDLGHDWLAKNEAGSGPYELAQWNQGSEFVIERDSDYWGGWDDPSPVGASGQPFETVRKTKVPEQSTIANLFGEREAVVTDNSLSPETYEQIEGMSGTEIHRSQQLSLHYSPIHCQKKPTDDKFVRKAITHAFDYQTAIEEIEGGTYPDDQARGPVPNNLEGHNDDIEPYEYDLDKAKDAIDQSSYTIDEINEIGITQHKTDPGGIRHREHLMLQSSLNEIGIKTEVVQTPWAEYSSIVADKETAPQIGLHNHSIKTLSPDSHTYLMHHPDAMGTYISMSWYNDPELTEVLEEARQTLDRDARHELYKEAQQMIVDAYPAIYISNPPWRLATHEPIDGVNYYGMLRWELNYHNMRWNP